MEFNLLIIDDDEIVCVGLSRVLEREGYPVDYTTDNESALNIIKEKEYDIILLDINMPVKSGLHLLPEIKAISVDSLIIMVTAYSDTEMAVKSMKAGAYDYFVKSSNYDELLIIIKKALEVKRLQRDVTNLHDTLYREYAVDRFIGRDPKIKEIFNNIRKVAHSKSTTVLITGESGTGKEMVAKYIHYLSERKKNPFIAENCAAISEGLCESELFGHEKGSFTDAKKDKKGIFELADGGTLFLDEMESMDLNLQSVLLRVLDDRRFRRLGGTQDKTVDVRVIAATNKNLEAMVKEGRFREDLFHRLNAFHIDLPPLRDRREDIIDLANFFIGNFNKLLGKNIEEIESGAKKILHDYNYPGNVRELKNIIERAMILYDGRTITSNHLLNIIPSRSDKRDDFEKDEINIPLKDIEKRYILKQLNLYKGNKTEAARRLGISRSTLNLKLKEFEKEKDIHDS